ncbi:MAG: flavin reductase [Christensenella sp.]|uniref:flavin reductase family protein n=1 Tax=Christensenella sp. TaxID=1935934 RepID=UPI002B20D9B4|nr:flavin reductase [Christensenella sp.]MEA5003432.1 flavin reductase [Christensenella sp.]
MKELTLGASAKLTSPHLFAAIVTKDDAGRVNIMGASWITFASLRDAKMVFCISDSGYTGGIVESTKKASLCFVTEKIADKIFKCCTTSGRTTDKIEAFGIALSELEGFDVPVPDGTGVAFSLELDEVVGGCDHGIYVCSVKKAVQLSEEPVVMAFDGYSRVGIL